MAARMGNAVAEVDKQAYFTVEKCVQSASAAVAPTWTSIYVSPGEYPELGFRAPRGTRNKHFLGRKLNAICPGRLGFVPMWLLDGTTHSQVCMFQTYTRRGAVVSWHFQFTSVYVPNMHEM